VDCAADHCDSEVGIETGSNIDDQEEAPADKAQDQLVEFRNKQARTVACCCSKEKKALLERGKCALAT